MRGRSSIFFAIETGSDAVPVNVDEAMADLAIVFHWSPADMSGFSLAELMQWREMARVRSQTDSE